MNAMTAAEINEARTRLYELAARATADAEAEADRAIAAGDLGESMSTSEVRARLRYLSR